MKLIESSRSINLSVDEIKIISQVMSPPFGDVQKFTNDPKFTRVYLNKMIQFLERDSSQDELVVKDGFLRDLCAGFKIGCDIIDPLEMPIITGYTWLEVMELYDKLYRAAFVGTHER